MVLRVGLRLGGGRARLERRSGWRLRGFFAESPSPRGEVAAFASILEDSVTEVEESGDVVLSSPEPFLRLKNNEVSLLW